MLIDTSRTICLRWWHLSFDEQLFLAGTLPEDYMPWELEFGYFVRIDGEVEFCEDAQEH